MFTGNDNNMDVVDNANSEVDQATQYNYPNFKVDREVRGTIVILIIVHGSGGGTQGIRRKLRLNPDQRLFKITLASKNTNCFSNDTSKSSIANEIAHELTTNINRNELKRNEWNLNYVTQMIHYTNNKIKPEVLGYIRSTLPSVMNPTDKMDKINANPFLNKMYNQEYYGLLDMNIGDDLYNKYYGGVNIYDYSSGIKKKIGVDQTAQWPAYILYNSRNKSSEPAGTRVMFKMTNLQDIYDEFAYKNYKNIIIYDFACDDLPRTIADGGKRRTKRRPRKRATKKRRPKRGTRKI